MTQTTPKEQYESSLQAILQIVMEMPQLSDGDWKAISDHTGKLWGMRDRLTAVREQVIIIERNTYYQRRLRPTPKNRMLTAQEKATSDEYAPCEYCESCIMKTHMKDHQSTTQKCINIRLTRERDKRHLNAQLARKADIKAFLAKYTLEIQSINHFIKQRIRDSNHPDDKGMFNYYNSPSPRR